MPLARVWQLAVYGAALRHVPRLGTAALQRAQPHMTAAAAVKEPRLLLTSTGLTTASMRESFSRMLDAANAPNAGPPRVAMVVTAQLAPSVRESSSNDEEDKMPRRSPGELRRRRWADARKKSKVISSELGVIVDCIDCARSPAPELREALEGAACIWVTGGNTFFLMHHLRNSGLDAIIRERLEAGAVYVGCSAGSIVAGASMQTAFWKGWVRR